MAAAILAFLLAVIAIEVRPCVAQSTGITVLDEAARRQAVAAIPFDRLPEPVRKKVWDAASRPSIFRRLPATVVEADPELYLYLVRYPEVVVNMWEVMGITKVKVRRTGPTTFEAADGAGTTGTVDMIYEDQGKHVFFSEGAYEGPLFHRLIRGRCVMVLQSAYRETVDRRVYITNQLEMFVQLDNVGAELVAKTLHPLVGRTADNNFVETSRFLAQVSLAAETKNAKLQQFSGRLANIDPQVRGDFIALVERVGQRAAARGGAHFTVFEDPAAGNGEIPLDASQMETDAGSSANVPDGPRPPQSPRR